MRRHVACFWPDPRLFSPASRLTLLTSGSLAAVSGRLLLAITVVLGTAVLQIANAEDRYPTHGLLYGDKGPSAVTFDCAPGRDTETIRCLFAITSARPKAAESELPKRLSEAKRLFRRYGGRGFLETECAAYRDLVAVLEGEKPETVRDGLHQLSAAERAEALAAGRMIVTACQSGTEEDYLEIVRRAHEKDARTCLVSTRTLVHLLRPAGAYSSGLTPWAFASKPRDACGVVTLIRFEPESVNGSVLWKLSIRTVNTNPQGHAPRKGTCGELDEESTYHWIAPSYTMHCEYLEFSFR